MGEYQAGSGCSSAAMGGARSGSPDGARGSVRWSLHADAEWWHRCPPRARSLATPTNASSSCPASGAGNETWLSALLGSLLHPELSRP